MGSGHFWTLKCRKCERRCGVKHISKLDHFWQLICRFVYATVARSTFPSQNVKGSDVVLHGGCKGFCTLSQVRWTGGFCSSFNYNHHYTTLHYITLHSTTLHYTDPNNTWLGATQVQLQLHDTNYIAPQLQLQHATITIAAALHHTTSSSCGRGGHFKHCNHFQKHKSSHLRVHQWIHSAIRDSEQPNSPIGFLFWNFCHRLVLSYW